MLRHFLRIGAVVCSVSLVLGYIAYASLYSKSLPLKQVISESDSKEQTHAPEQVTNNNATIPAEIRAIIPSTKSAPIDLRPSPSVPDQSILPRMSTGNLAPSDNRNASGAVNPSTKSIIIGGGAQVTPSYTPQQNSNQPNRVPPADPLAPSSNLAPPPVRK